MFVDSLVRLLSDEPDLVVVGLAGTLAQGIRSAQEHDPDVVLLDFRLPDGDAPAGIAQLRDVTPNARVLIMTGLSDDATLTAARNAGCAGVLTKDRAARDLVEAVRSVASGAPIADADRAAQNPSALPAASSQTLSSREREVPEQLAAGRSTEAIATALHISIVTVRNHIQHLMAKLGARSRLEAVALAIEAGIIAAPPHRPRAS